MIPGWPWPHLFWRWQVVSRYGPGCRPHTPNEGCFYFREEADAYADVLRRIGVEGVKVKPFHY